MDPLPEDFKVARSVAREYTNFVLGLSNVVGCGVGHRRAAGRETSEFVFAVFVTRKLPASALRPEEIVPRELSVAEGTIRTDVVEQPPMRFGADTAQYRPLPGGCQIGTVGGSGTVGGIVYDASDNEPVLLTCNHVLTVAGQRSIIPMNAAVSQPSAGPSIGRTKRIVPWLPVLPGTDLEASVDAGIVDVNPDVGVQFRVLDLGKHPYVILPAYVGLEVVKRGYVSETTRGQVTYLDVVALVTDSDKRIVRIGGVGSSFRVQAEEGETFMQKGDSGSLVVDANLGNARGMVFASDFKPGGITDCCQLGAIFGALRLETPCSGGLHGMIRRAVYRRPLSALAQSGLAAEGRSASAMTRHVDKFRDKFMPDNPDGKVSGAFGSMLQMLATDLAEAVYADEDFAGLLDEAFGDWLVLPTVYDMLEYRLPDDFETRVLRAFDHLQRCRPHLEGLDWLRPGFAACGGMRMRDVLGREVSPRASVLAANQSK